MVVGDEENIVYVIFFGDHLLYNRSDITERFSAYKVIGVLFDLSFTVISDSKFAQATKIFVFYIIFHLEMNDTCICRFLLQLFIGSSLTHTYFDVTAVALMCYF